jgi:hypothetical protein
MDLAKIIVNGVPVPVESSDIMDVRIERALSATAVCDITIACSRTGGPQQALAPDWIVVGAALAIDGGPGANALTRIFDGEITAVTYEVDDLMGEHVIVRAADKSHRLWLEQSKVVSNEVKLSDVMTKIVQGVGLRPSIVEFSQTRPYDVQLGSPGDHLQSICASHGVYWYVWKDTLHVKTPAEKPSATVDVEYGKDLTRISGRATTAVGPQQLASHGWNPKTVQAVVGKSGKVADLHTSALTTIADKVTEFNSTPGTTSAHVAVDAKEAERYAQADVARAVASRIQVRIECRKPTALATLIPGAEVKVGSVGAELDGTYRIATAVHVWSAGAWRTTLTTGTLEPPTFGELVGAAVEAPAWDTSCAMIGIVTDIQPSSADIVGMVLVKFPVLTSASGTDVVSAWARVVSAGAGKNRGLQIMPSVNDEVVVVFEQGDPRRPLVIGGLWNGQAVPPLDKTKFSDGSTAVAWQMTTPEGRNIVMSDKDKFVSITCKEANLKLYLGEDKVELWAKAKTTLELKSGDASVLLDADGNVTVKGKAITLEATDDVTIQGKSVKIKAETKVDISGSSAVAVSSGSGGSVDVDANVKLTGTKVQING